MTLTSGTKLGPYEVVAPAGAGGMGEVYRARDMRLNRDVAVKILAAPFAREGMSLGRPCCAKDGAAVAAEMRKMSASRFIDDDLFDRLLQIA